LPECFRVLRGRWEAADSRGGTREFIRVLRLHEEFGPSELEAALRLSTITVADVRVLLERTREAPAPPLSLEGRPQWKAIQVGRPDLSGYGELLGEREVQP
jgi:hypothetical protein